MAIGSLAEVLKQDLTPRNAPSQARMMKAAFYKMILIVSVVNALFFNYDDMLYSYYIKYKTTPDCGSSV